MRRLKLLKITSDVLRALLIQDGQTALRIEGMPVDARIDGAMYDLFNDNFVLRIESDSFPEVPDADRPPNLDLKMEDITAPIQTLFWKLDNLVNNEDGGYPSEKLEAIKELMAEEFQRIQKLREEIATNAR